MRPIDFLPSKYREQSAIDQAKLWHLGVVCLFGAVVAAAALYQFAVRRSVSVELAEVDAHYQAAQQQAQELAGISVEMEKACGEARLYAYLRHTWPRTQILSLLATNLPDEVTLSEARIELAVPESTRNAPRSEQPATSNPANPGAAAPPKPAPAVADLIKLRSAREGAQSQMHLHGSTRDVSALHSYLAELAAHPLVAKAELISLEQAGPSGSGQADVAIFRARVSIKPDYTQSDGPTMPAESIAPPSPAQVSSIATPAAGGAP